MDVQVAGEDLDIEDPFGEEGLCEDFRAVLVDAKQLGAALAVVNRHLEHKRDDGCEYAAEIVPHGNNMTREPKTISIAGCRSSKSRKRGTASSGVARSASQ